MGKFLLGILTGVAGLAVAAIISERIDDHQGKISFSDEDSEPGVEETGENSKVEGTGNSESPEEKMHASVLGQGIGFIFKGVK